MPKIITTNMAIDKCDPAGRYERFGGYCLDAKPDIIIVQEICHDVGQAALQGLAEELGGDYRFLYAPVYPGQEDSQGIGVITDMEIRDHRAVTPIAGMNKIQLLELMTKEGQAFQLANIHAEAHLLLDLHRKLKLARLISRLNGRIPHILAGDFNAPARFPSIRYLKRHYASAHESRHGREPAYTYPTDMGEDLLLRGGDATPFQIFAMKAGALCQKPENRRPTGLPRVVADYIFINDLVRVDEVRVTGHDSVELAHSDHLGLEADLVLS